jgi:hypothetical protein
MAQKCLKLAVLSTKTMQVYSSKIHSTVSLKRDFFREILLLISYTARVMLCTLLNPLQIYSAIQKDGLIFVSLYFKIRTSDKYDVNCI